MRHFLPAAVVLAVYLVGCKGQTPHTAAQRTHRGESVERSGSKRRVAHARCAAPDRSAGAIGDTPTLHIDALTDQNQIDVKVSVSVSATGRVLAARIASPPSPEYPWPIPWGARRVVLRLARHARYNPRLENCEPVAGNAVYLVRFWSWSRP